MNVIRKLTLRHIVSHKKRTILTIMSIIVSVAMVTAVFTTIFSFTDFMVDVTTEVSGPWQAKYLYHEEPDLSLFDSPEDVADIAVVRPGRSFSLHAEDKLGRERGVIAEADEAVCRLRSVRIAEGRFPQNTDELLVGRYFLDRSGLDAKVGDKITLFLQSGEPGEYTEKEFTLVGIADDNADFFSKDYPMITVPDDGSPSEEDYWQYAVYCRFTTMAASTYDLIDEYTDRTGCEMLETNRDLFIYSLVPRDNGLLRALGAVVAVVLALIVIVSVAIIYDSFAVSYQERARYLGMLASVGATKKQKRASVYFEAFILGLVGIPLGFAAGLGGIAVTFLCIRSTMSTVLNVNTTRQLSVRVNLPVLAGTLVLSVLTLFIASYVPARRASKTTAIDAVRSGGEQKLRPRRLRGAGVMGKLFGFSGAMASKNSRRSPRRTRNIVIAMGLSVVMFVSVANFSKLLEGLLAIEVGAVEYDMIASLYPDTNAKDETEKLLDWLDSEPGVRERVAQTNEMFAALDGNGAELLTDEVLAYQENIEEPGIRLLSVDGESFARLLAIAGIKDTPDWHDPEAPKALALNTIVLTEGRKKTVCKTFREEVVGETLELIGTDINNNGEYRQVPFSISVGGIADEMIDWLPASSTRLSYLVLPFDVRFALPQKAMDLFSISVGIKADDPTSQINALEDFASNEGFSLYVNDVGANYASTKAIFTIFRVFLIGFISLMSLISVLNIVNTLSNSMNERRREFAVLRSVGMTGAQFKRMIYAECLRYGFASLLWSLPLSLGLHVLMHLLLSQGVDLGFTVHPLFTLLAAAGVGVIIIVSLALTPQVLKGESVIETIKQDIL